MKRAIFSLVISSLLVVLSLISIIWFTVKDVELSNTHYWTLLLVNLMLTVSLLVKDLSTFINEKENDKYGRYDKDDFSDIQF